MWGFGKFVKIYFRKELNKSFNDRIEKKMFCSVYGEPCHAVLSLSKSSVSLKIQFQMIFVG